MIKATILAAGLAGAVSASVLAQSMPQISGSAGSTTAPAQEDAASFARPGMLVKDAEGAAIGSVVTAGKSSATGEPVVVVSVDGKRLNLAAASLNPAGNELVSSMTKAQILAAAKAPG